MSVYDDVYGVSYKSADEQMKLGLEKLKEQQGVGFESYEDLVEWAHKNNLDKLVFSNVNHQFMCVSHKGEIMTPSTYEHYYGNILYYKEHIGKEVVLHYWKPDGFEYYDKAYIVSEQSDGVHRPLYYRDYCLPTGYYSAERDAFNSAKPFPVFAKETGRDTSHIYTYIEHLAGECAWHLLAWLRAKLLYPTVKTQVVPIIVSRTQGSGKTTFAEVICKGLFGKDNVIVSDQYDATARFNADYADALIVCQEEKEELDKRNPAGALKSRATATTIRKELKGIDPIYQESYTDFIMTTNKDVPIKFDGREDQRRFMIMESDPLFTRKTSPLADEIFTKLYGFNANYQRVGKPFVEDAELIAQFKHELFTREDIAKVELRNFPKTAAYKRCFTLPRTTESTEIESILRAIVPFIKKSLESKTTVTDIDDLHFTDTVQYSGAMQYMPAYKDMQAFVALCRPLIFYDLQTNKPYAHSTVERAIYDSGPWLASEYGISVVPDMDPLPGGFTKVAGRYRTAPAARFCLMDSSSYTLLTDVELPEQDKSINNRQTDLKQRQGKRFRVNKYFNPDKEGCFETVNELPLDTKSLSNKTKRVLYMDTFLLESDEGSAVQDTQSEKRASAWKEIYGEGSEIKAELLYKERLKTSLSVSQKLFDDGIVARIVYSGAKSYHLLIRVADAPQNLDEYRWLHSWLCLNLTDKITFDSSTSDPARLTRSPLTLQRNSSNYGLIVIGEQKLVCEDWNHIYDFNWRSLYEQWLQRPKLSIEQKYNKALYPTKTEYVDAASCISDGTFWSSEKFNGDRQRLFFPAYRLLKVLGYTHNEIFNVILPKGLKNYKKQDEVNYWLSRDKSSIIAQIDKETDEYNNSIEEV